MRLFHGQVAGSAYDRVIVYSKRFSGMDYEVAKIEDLTFAVRTNLNLNLLNLSQHN